jgi:D-beta-D-heptose 7-phosphate kinase/D-beta-D-heptose 1-phosphate adenosyltransferase
MVAMSSSPRSASSIPYVIPWEELTKLLDNHRAEGKKIVFTNGVFDLIHPGHIRYLREAKTLGDILVVALNTDESVTRLKGPNRPILPLSERAKILAALEAVDYVTAFDEDTPAEILRFLRPDILVKGGDYTPNQVVGKDFVESYGGVCRTLNFVEGYSTSSIIEHIIEMTQKAAR